MTTENATTDSAYVPSEAEVEAVLREHESCDYVITDDYDAAFECGIVVKALPSPSLAAMGRRHLAAALVAAHTVTPTPREDVADGHAYNLARIVEVLNEWDDEPIGSPAWRVVDAVRCVIPDWAADQPLSAFTTPTPPTDMVPAAALADRAACLCGQPWNRPDVVEHGPTQCSVRGGER